MLPAAMFDAEDARQAFLSLPGAEETQPFGPDVLVYKIGGRMFGTLMIKDGVGRINLKCDPQRAVEQNRTSPIKAYGSTRLQVRPRRYPSPFVIHTNPGSGPCPPAFRPRIAAAGLGHCSGRVDLQETRNASGGRWAGSFSRLVSVPCPPHRGLEALD